jgi:hypothetical protein
MAADLAGGRTDRDAGNEGGAEQKACAKAPGAEVHALNPLIGHAMGGGARILASYWKDHLFARTGFCRPVFNS